MKKVFLAMEERRVDWKTKEPSKYDRGHSIPKTTQKGLTDFSGRENLKKPVDHAVVKKNSRNRKKRGL